MRGLRLERPPVWGILALVLLVLGNVAVLTVMTVRPTPADTYTPRAATSITDAAEPSDAEDGEEPPAASTPQAPVTLHVYGDGYAVGNELGGLDSAGWPALVAQRIGAELVLTAVPRAGYASVGVSGEIYLDLVERSPAGDATVTVLFGSRNDADEDLALVQSNAAQAIAAIRQGAPGTTLVVVGPAWSDADVPAAALAVRDAVRAAAEAGGATFVDPLADGWFAQRPELIASDGISPTDGGHVYLADLLAPVLQKAVTPATGTAG
ncbi:SGNH/GDSL hydrolase family protein [Blastococcus deserti]|uniref:SGNH/GDSL hydrolase family protein n=1 Tax=Blastococcus deserti TaxID=2259033 RepID=A0ABW4XBS6_9ACTN